MNDNIEHPAHYSFGMMEAREIIELAIADIPDTVAAYHVATTLKYFLRASRKCWTEDIAKGCKHAGWALDAAKAHDVRKLRDIPPPHCDPDSVAFRHGDIDAVCGLPNVGRGRPNSGIRDAGEFTQPPNCSSGVSEARHPMHAVALEMAEDAILQRVNKGAATKTSYGYHITWPGEVGN